MTNEQLYLAIGVPILVNFAGIGGLYLLMKSELNGLRKDITNGFERQELLLKLHEAEHHHK